MRLKVEIATAAVGHVRVQLRSRQIGVSEHLLHAAEVGSAFQQVGGERVPEQVGMDPLGLEPGRGREPSEDEERAGARQRPTLGVQEQLGPVAAVQIWPPAREVALKRVYCLPPDRDDSLLVSLSDAADEPLREVDAGLVEPDGLADAQTGAVEQLDQRAVAQIARTRSARRLDEPFRLARGERPRKAPGPARKLELGGGIVGAGAE